jgi:vitamin B12 transporter
MGRAFLLFFIQFTVSIVSFAQQRVLDSVVVSATFIPQKDYTTGRNIITLRGADFNKLPVSSIDEWLRYVPGVEVQQRGPQGAQSDIIIRGGTFQQVLVVIDGIRLNDPLTGHFSTYIPLHPEDIEKIEVIKGAAAAVYGADAIGGVVNIITKLGSSQTDSTPLSISGRLQWGDQSLVNRQFRVAGKIGKGRFSVAEMKNKAAGYPLRGTNGFFDNQTISVAYAGKIANNWQLQLRYAKDSRDFNAQNFYTPFLSDTAREKVVSDWLRVGVVRSSSQSTFTVEGSYKILRDQFQFNPSGSPNLNTTELYIAQTKLSHTINQHNSLVTGIQYFHKKIISNDRGNHSLGHAGGYLILSHQPLPRLHINESVRLDWDESYGWQLLPQLNAAYSTGSFTGRASVGKGIRDADFTERYNNYNKVLVTAGNIGNPQLQPEKSWNYEAGFDYRLSRKMKISFTGFFRSQQNLIDWTPTPYAQMPRKTNLVNTGNYALATNLWQVSTKGLELDFQYVKKMGKNQQLTLLSGLVWMESLSNEQTPSFYLSSHARFLWNTQLIWRMGAFEMAVTSVYKERNTQQAKAIKAAITPSYFLLNSRISFFTYQQKLSLQLDCTNITNTKYSDLLGAAMPGRWASAGLYLKL